MYMYILVAFVLLLLTSGIVYSILKIHKIPVIRKIKNNRISWLLSITPLILFTIFMFVDSINTIIVYIYFILFLLLGDFLTFLMKKIGKEKIDYSMPFGLGGHDNNPTTDLFVNYFYIRDKSVFENGVHVFGHDKPLTGLEYEKLICEDYREELKNALKIL